MNCLLAVSLTLLSATLAQASCPLSGIKPAAYNQDQTYQNKQTPFVWYFSPCSMGAAPAEGSCNPASGYFQEFDTQENGAGCQMSLTEIKKPWTYFRSTVSGVSGYSATFANTAGDRIADITVVCDREIVGGNLSPVGSADVSSLGNGFFNWQITLRSDQACGSTPNPSSGSGSFAPSFSASSGDSESSDDGFGICPNLQLAGIKPAVYSQIQNYYGSEQVFDWYFDPCMKGAAPGRAACSPMTGYFQEFDAPANGGSCQMSLDSVLQNWADISVGDTYGYFAKFGNPGDRVVDITILCNSSAGNLSPKGPAVATQSSTGVIHWDVVLSSDRVCRATPAPTFAPSTGCGQFSDSGCTGCTKAPSGTCGYCLQSKTCEEGSSNGPANGACPSSDWEWYPDQCQN